MLFTRSIQPPMSVIMKQQIVFVLAITALLLFTSIADAAFHTRLERKDGKLYIVNDDPHHGYRVTLRYHYHKQHKFESRDVTDFESSSVEKLGPGDFVSLTDGYEASNYVFDTHRSSYHRRS